MKIQKHIRQAALIALAAGFILTGCGQGNPIVSSAPEAVQAGEQVPSVVNPPRTKAITDVLNLNAEQGAVLAKLRNEYCIEVQNICAVAVSRPGAHRGEDAGFSRDGESDDGAEVFAVVGGPRDGVRYCRTGDCRGAGDEGGDSGGGTICGGRAGAVGDGGLIDFSGVVQM